MKTAIQDRIDGSKGAKRVGRKRIPQPKEIAKTMAGRFGARLLELSEQAGLSADELGDKIGKSRQAIFAYYSGQRVPHIDEWPALAKALGVKPKDLVPE